MTMMTTAAVRSAWQPLLSGAEAERAIAMATTVAERLDDVGTVAAAVAATKRQSNFPTSAHWDPVGIASGHSGFALLDGYLDATLGEQGWDRAAHRHLAAAARYAERGWNRGDGLYSGYGGLLLATWALSRAGTRYANMLEQLKHAMLPRIDALARHVGRATGIGTGDWDVISGTAGIIASLLPLRDDPDVARTIGVAVESLVALLADTGDALPRWHTPATMLGDPRTVEQYPFGNLNCGLAHGIPGALAALSLAHRDGVEVDGLAETIARIAAWVVEHRIEDAWGVAWPYAIPVSGEGTTPLREAPGEAWRAGPSRSAWCYGSPGVARAVWLAGDALGDDALRALAVEAIEAVVRRPPDARGIDAPTLCHGVGGVLLILLRFAAETGSPVLVAGARAMCEQLFGEFDPGSLLGFRDLEPGENRVDRPGLLDGAAGVALALLAASSPAEPAWDRLFLIT